MIQQIESQIDQLYRKSFQADELAAAIESHEQASKLQQPPEEPRK